ncbi:SPOR domain-containing protein [Actibacterium sp. D379-3]
MARANYDEYDTPTAPPARGALQTATTWAGAVTSVVLVVGLAVWGYRLTVRDVSGVPVVRALEGPMRIAPEDPGGSQADHQGLAVNRVAAEGEAAPPADRLLLAPRPVDLADEDAPRADLRPQPQLKQAAPEPATPPAETTITAPDPVTAAVALAMAEERAPQDSPAELEIADTLATSDETAPEDTDSTRLVPDPVPGVVSSPRPRPRPEGDLAARAAINAVTAAATPAKPEELAASAVLPGTNLVQLGAFDSADVARAEWQRLSSRFDSLMDGKQRLIQSAVSGGHTFYRLRAVGFTDISDARRFCAALTAEKADCIPVVAR